MKPTQGDVHVNQPLSNILVAYMQDESRSVATKVFPVVPVSHKTDTYYKWVRDDFSRIEAAERAPGTEAEGGGFSVSTDTYECKEYAIKKDIPDPIRDNADAELDLDAAASEYIGMQLILKREKLWLDTFFKSGVWTGQADQAGVSGTPSTNQFKQWNDAASNPIEDIRAAIYSIENATGYRPNKLVIGPFVEKALLDHPDIIDRIKYVQKGVATLELFASLLGLDQVLVPRLVYNSAKEGQTASFGFMAAKSALLLYAPSSPSMMSPSAGYTFAWTSRFGNGAQGQRIKKYRLEQLDSDRIEGQMTVGLKVVASDCAAFFGSVVA